jgi:mannose-1-phosphate guanylyltransferase
MSRWAAVLAGGSGTRFWPLSTPSLPKQFLALDGEIPLLEAAVGRLEGLIPVERILVITGQTLVARTRELLQRIPPENVLGEPRAASTAPALTWATHVAGTRDSAASVLSLHADWCVGDDAAFRRTATRALDVAESEDVLVTVGIVPTRPETGYGYIVPGGELEGDARRVDRFVEKPDAENATQLMAQGALWNSGLFAWTVRRFRDECVAHAPEIAPHLASLEAGNVDDFFATVTPIAIDHSHFERSDRVGVIPGQFLWDDVGTWAALTRVRDLDDGGNVLVGSAISRESRDCVIWAEDGPVVVDGLDELVVVRANGVTLVTTRDRASGLKTLLSTLPPEIREPN